jgi:hypothetical protein
MQTLSALEDNARQGGPASSPASSPSSELREDAALPPSVEVRCGPAETAAIIRLLDNLDAARAAAESWDGVTRDRHQRVRQKYSRLLADLFQRHPDEILAGLTSPQAHTRIWIALTIAQAPNMRALCALKQAIAAESDERARLALARALLACKGTATLQSTEAAGFVRPVAC